MQPSADSIRYSDVVCLITGHDAEWSRRDPELWSRQGASSKSSFRAVAGTVDGALEHVFEEVERICQRFCTNMNTYAGQAYPQACGTEDGLVEKCLFRPLRYLPIAHADTLSITLFDDLDPIHDLTARCSTTVEEVAIGFAPTMASLGRDEWTASFKECLVDVTEFVRQGLRSQEMPEGTPGCLPPLLHFSRIKLGALGMLGHGIEFQTAVFRAILKDCLRSLEVLLKMAEDGELDVFDADKDSVLSCRITLLDLQGQEEVGLLIACDNYSVAAALLSRIQGLKLHDVAGPDSAALPGMGRQKWVGHAKELLADMGEELPEGMDEMLCNSHALRWTWTTLAMRSSAFRDPSAAHLRGYVDLISAANIAVGHQDRLDKMVAAMQKSLDEVDTRPASPGPPEVFRQQLMGHVDLLVHHASPDRPHSRLMHLRQAMEQVRRLITGMGPKENNDDVMPRHLVGLSSWPTIPVPLHAEFQREIQPHYPLLQKILPVIRWRMVDFGAKDEGDDSVRNEEERKIIRVKRRVPEKRYVAPGLCPYTLRKKPMEYLLPNSLLRTIQYLFQNYSTLLANPFVFDTVLDLYDCFATTYEILTKHLPGLYSRKPGTGYPPQIPAEVVPQLSRYISALHRAMEHRLYRAFPEEAHRDMDVDFRGGLNQLISGADALLKSSMGFVKRLALPRGTFAVGFKLEGVPPPRFNHFGVVNRIDFEPEIVATSLWLGTEHKARLAIIRSDVPHLCVVASYIDFIHEVGHIVFAEHRNPREREDLPADEAQGREQADEAEGQNSASDEPHDNGLAEGPDHVNGPYPRTEQDGKGKPAARRLQALLPLVPLKSSTEEMLGEIYTHALSTLLVCCRSPSLFAQHSMVGFALATRHGADIATRYANFLRFCFQIFVAARCIQELQARAANSEQEWGAYLYEEKTRRIVSALFNDDAARREEFRLFVLDNGRICHDFKEYLEHDPHHGFLQSAYDYNFECVRYSLPILIANVVTVYLRFVARNFDVDEESRRDGDDAQRRPGQKETDTAVKKAQAASNIKLLHRCMMQLEQAVSEELLLDANRGLPVVHVARQACLALARKSAPAPSPAGTGAPPLNDPAPWLDETQAAARVFNPDKIEGFFLIVMALGTALRFRMEALKIDPSQDMEFKVPLHPRTGDIDFKNQSRSKDRDAYSDYLIRPKDSFLFCCKPAKRRERLQRQIALLKTLWSTASQIKARRFESLIQNAMSRPQS